MKNNNRVLQSSAPLGNLSDALWNSPAFFEKKWEGKSTSAKAWKEAVKGKIDTASRDISSIRAVGGKYTADLLVKYFETLSMEGVFEHKKSWNQQTLRRIWYRMTCPRMMTR